MSAKSPADSASAKSSLGGKKAYYSTLDLIRGLAALFVVLGHSRNMFFVDYAEVHNHSLFLKAFYFLCGFGHQAVIIFFVLSGCVVGRMPIIASRNNNWSWNNYLFDRITRLWVVLLPGLLLTLFWDKLSLVFANEQSFVFGGSMGHSLHGPLAAKLGVAAFFGNFFFLQTIAVATFGTNSPLWSLANEFWYYLLFPIFFRAFYAKNPVLRLLHLALGIGGLCFVGRDIAVLFLVWLMGAAVFRLNEKYKLVRHAQVLFFAALLLNAAVLVWLRLNTAANSSNFNPIMEDILLGLTVSILIFAALSVNLPKVLSKIAAFFARFSFSLYVLHMPLLAFIGSVFIQTNEMRRQPDMLRMALFGCLLFTVYAYAFMIYWATERKTTQVRRQLEAGFLSTWNKIKPSN